MLFDLGYGMFMKIWGAINRGCPGVDPYTPWRSLSAEQQGEMDQAVAMLREAADQGHMRSQGYLGYIYSQGLGVAKDKRLAFVYTERAARQGNSGCQYNMGNFYRSGHGCKQIYARAVEWYEGCSPGPLG